MTEAPLAFPRLQPQFFPGVSQEDFPKKPPQPPSQPRLIGLSGKARSGKDTISGLLYHAFKVQRVSFAEPLKRAMQEMFELHDRQLYGPEKEATIAHLGVSPRQLLQGISDVWWKALVDEGLKSVDVLRNENMHVVVTDVRCEYAVHEIRRRGGNIWHVVSERATGQERPLKFVGGDQYISNDGSLEDLYDEVCVQF